MIFLLLVNAAFDVFGLMAIYPLIDAALEPSLIQEKWYLNVLYTFGGFDDYVYFLFILSILVLFILILKNVISLFITYIQARFSFNVSLRLNHKMFQYYFERGYLYIKKEDIGKRLYNISNIPKTFASNYLMDIFLISTELVVLIIIFLLISFMYPSVVLILLAIVVPTLLGVYSFSKNKVKKIGAFKQKYEPVKDSLLIESTNGYVDVVLDNKENFFLNQYKSLQKRLNDQEVLFSGIYNKLPQKFNDIILGLGIVIIFSLSMVYVDDTKEILAMLSVFGIAAYRFLPSTNKITAAVISLKGHYFVPEILQAVANKKAEKFQTASPLIFDKNIELNNIQFFFNPQKIILNNLSIRINKGEIIGIIGPSGSGKSTLMNIILRFLKETSGTIKVDNEIIKEDIAWRKNIGYVQQETFIKKGTLLENIAFGEEKSEVNLQKAKQAALWARLNSFINENNKLNYFLGENGSNLSGGQKQRIGIARALYRDTQLLLFDEATSALDPNTENEIKDTILSLKKLGKTIIIIAHRFSSLEGCDKIYEITNGTVSRTLSYQELHNEVN